MQFAVETWSPDFGAPSDDAVLVESEVPVDAWVERAVEDWAPIQPAADQGPAASLLFIDGVRRVEAVVWITTDGGEIHQGICASYAAGAVRCNGSAQVVQAEVRRGVFSPCDGAGPIDTRHGRFVHHPVVEDRPDHLVLAVQQRMGDLEAKVAELAGGAEIVLVDGPLKLAHEQPGFVGFVKTHTRSYGDRIVLDTVAALGGGERTPILLIDGRRPKYSWYLRLPCRIAHGWSGVVRLETTSDQPLDDVVRLADQLAVMLPRFASTPHKDARAPQNLVPIGGLERELRHRLGDPQLLHRALRAAAGPPADQRAG